MITLLDKQGREIQEQDNITERIQEFYSELYDSDVAVTIQTYPEEVLPIMARGSGSCDEENEKWERSGNRSS